ncbi:MAG: PEP-CTERM sorting domain-containing protein [Capsulimonadales bacterium]|nr:PEP-CTERM sorting domain-containing protein [Capsulimonadales bacterium]
MNRAVRREFVASAIILAILGAGSTSYAQAVIRNQTTYNSLTAIAGNNPNQSDVTGNILTLTGHGVEPLKNVQTGPAAYAFRFGSDGTTDGSVDPALGTANVGNNTLSTILIADDLWLQADTTGLGSARLASVNLTGMQFLLSNANAEAITVNAHVRLYDTLATGFAGDLVGSYDLGAVTLNGNGGGYASVTQLSVPSSSFALDPVSLAGSTFDRVSAGRYEKRIWAGLFFTADATTTTTTQLSNIGSVVFDPNTAVLSENVSSKGTFFDVGRSNDQIVGDDISGANNGPQVNFSYTQDFDELFYTSLFKTWSLDTNNQGQGPEANFAWLFRADIVITPEPGTVSLLILGALPAAILIRRRRR